MAAIRSALHLKCSLALCVSAPRLPLPPACLHLAPLAAAAGHVPAWWVFDALGVAAPRLLLPAAPAPGMPREQAAAAAKWDGGGFFYVI